MAVSLRCGGLIFAACALTAVPAARISAQLVGQRSVPSTYAITNARLVPMTGAVIPNGTIVIRDGLIVAVGALVTVPADARIIDGAGLTVYPGFIDAYGTLGLGGGGGAGRGGGGRGGGGGAPAAGAPAGGAQGAGREGAPNSANPPGLQPEVIAVDLLEFNDDAFSGALSAGITAAVTAPGSGIFQGQSALINLHGADLAALVIKTPIAQQIGFTPLRNGGYPNSLMGVFSSLRQMLLDAQHYRDELTAYNANPRGARRPAYDASLEALQPVLTKQQPVVMYAMTQRGIERALDIAREFNLRVVIAGGREAPLVAERLKAEGVPVLLSANFPRPPVTAASADADPEPLRTLRERADAPKAPAKLAAAGVTFALISGGANWSEHLANVRKAIENGLTADQALRALTVAPAELLGVGDRLGSLEVGKIANLTISTGDALAVTGKVTQVFVDGRPVAVRAPAAGTAATAAGAWTVAVSIDGVERAVTLRLQQESGKITGSIQGELGSNDLADGSIGADGELSFHVSITLKEGTEAVTFQGHFELDTIRGRVLIVGHDPGTFAGTRPAASGGRGRGGPPGGSR